MLKTLNRKVLIFAAVIGLLIFLHLLKILAPVESLISRIFNPWLAGLYSAGSDLRQNYKERARSDGLAATVRELEDRIKELTVENARLKVVEEENRILREQLRFLSNNNQGNYILAKIISRGLPGSLGQSNQRLMIDKGSRDGLTAGLAVISSQGVMVGKVKSVKDHQSEVDLITNPASQFAAMIENKDHTSGIVKGELGLVVKMEFIPQNENIGPGNIVVTSGMEQYIPAGLVIGRVNEINNESNELWQSAVIEPLENLDSLLIVTVLLP